MKKLIMLVFVALVMVFMFSSCASMKRDCNGTKHYKLKNGIYL